MPRLIDARAIALQVQRNLMMNVDDCGMVTVEDAERHFLRLLDKAPSVDAVEVVRCRDCAVPHDEWSGCPKMASGFVPPPDFHCGFGVRKDGDG